MRQSIYQENILDTTKIFWIILIVLFPVEVESNLSLSLPSHSSLSPLSPLSLSILSLSLSLSSFKLSATLSDFCSSKCVRVSVCVCVKAIFLLATSF